MPKKFLVECLETLKPVDRYEHLSHLSQKTYCFACLQVSYSFQGEGSGPGLWDVDG